MDHSQFWALYEEALPRIYGYLLHRSNRAVAEDLTQEVFSTLARAMSSGDVSTPSMGWLFSVAKSRLYDHLRARQRDERNRVAAWSQRSAGSVTVEQSYDDRNLGECAQQALDALPVAQRAALVLHHLDDLSVFEVADRIGRSVPATESLLARARRGFRTAFEEADHG